MTISESLRTMLTVFSGILLLFALAVKNSSNLSWESKVPKCVTPKTSRMMALCVDVILDLLIVISLAEIWLRIPSTS
jgi:hypothetical protein